MAGGEGADDMGGEDQMASGGDELGGDELGGEGEPIGDGLGDEGDDEFGDEDFEGEDDFGGEEFDDEEGDDIYEDDLESRMDALEELLGAIADKLGVSAPGVDAENYEDDELFDDEEGDEFGDDGFEGEDNFGGEEDFGAEEPEFGDDEFEGEDEFGDDEFEDEPIEDETDLEMPMESRRRNGVQIIETAAYKRAMRKQRMNEEGMTAFTDNGRVPSGNMNKLDDFGKHPAYRKEVMTLPPNKEIDRYGKDWNDDSAKGEEPFGKQIGSSAPYTEKVVDMLTDAIFNRLKKKV
jgi:hypothetical protein